MLWKKKTREYLNICQNNLIRQIIGLHKYCHISKILNALKILNFEKLYIKSKLSFIKSIKYNELSLYIFKSLVQKKNEEFKKKSKSFIKDILSLEKYFKTSIELISETKTLSKLYNSLKDEFQQEDGVTDSI